jgi:hypothetical protein
MPRVSGILERIEYANGIKGIITSQDEMMGALRRSMYKVPRGFLLKSTDEAFSWDAGEGIHEDVKEMPRVSGIPA